METSNLLIRLKRDHTDNPIKRKELANRCGISERELREHITILNKAGLGVISDDSGIFFTENVDAISRCAMRYISMGQETLDKGRALERAAQKIRDRQQRSLAI